MKSLKGPVRRGCSRCALKKRDAFTAEWTQHDTVCIFQNLLPAGSQFPPSRDKRASLCSLFSRQSVAGVFCAKTEFCSCSSSDSCRTPDDNVATVEVGYIVVFFCLSDRAEKHHRRASADNQRPLNRARS